MKKAVKTKKYSRHVLKRSKKPRLMEFYGTECAHCRAMNPLIAKLERELKLKIQKYEVWHNDKNAALLESIDQGRCEGVPFLYNADSHEFICGEVDYETLKAWAKKRK